MEQKNLTKTANKFADFFVHAIIQDQILKIRLNYWIKPLMEFEIAFIRHDEDAAEMPYIGEFIGE